MKIVETSHCGVSMCFIAVGWTAAASSGQAPLSLPGCCLPGNCLSGCCRGSGSLLVVGRGLCCRRSLTYGYGRLRLSDAGEAVGLSHRGSLILGGRGCRGAGMQGCRGSRPCGLHPCLMSAVAPRLWGGLCVFLGNVLVLGKNDYFCRQINELSCVYLRKHREPLLSV